MIPANVNVAGNASVTESAPPSYDAHGFSLTGIPSNGARRSASQEHSVTNDSYTSRHSDNTGNEYTSSHQ